MVCYFSSTASFSLPLFHIAHLTSSLDIWLLCCFISCFQLVKILPQTVFLSPISYSNSTFKNPFQINPCLPTSIPYCLVPIFILFYYFLIFILFFLVVFLFVSYPQYSFSFYTCFCLS